MFLFLMLISVVNRVRTHLFTFDVDVVMSTVFSFLLYITL